MSTVNRDHILEVPKFVLAIRAAQLALGVIILGLAAYGVTYIAFDGDSLSLFTALATIIIVVYNVVSFIKVPQVYNYWAILGLDIFAVFFWLISFALLASEVAALSIVATCDGYYYDYCLKKRDVILSKRGYTNIVTYRNAMAAASGLGGLEFVLFIVTLVFIGLNLHRHRQNGGHCMPNSNGNVSAPEPKGLELGQNTQQPVVYPVQQEQQVASV